MKGIPNMYAVIFILLFMLATAFAWQDHIWEGIDWDGYMSGLFTETVGAIITLVFIGALIKRYRARENYDNKNKALIKNWELLEPYFSSYFEAVYNSTRATKDRLKPVPKEFEILPKDIANLHQPYPEINIGMEKGFERINDAEMQLKQEIKNFYRESDLSHKIDMGSTIISAINTTAKFQWFERLRLHEKGKIDGDYIFKSNKFLKELEQFQSFPDALKSTEKTKKCFYFTEYVKLYASFIAYKLLYEYLNSNIQKTD